MVRHGPPVARLSGRHRHEIRVLRVFLCLPIHRTFGFSRELRRVAWKPLFAELIVVRPHSNDLDGLDLVENLIHKPVLDVDSTGTRAREISHSVSKRGGVW
jgi:hypothetical protein